MSEHNDNGEQQDVTVPEGTSASTATADGVRTYRGRNLAELLPQIREELGPDAVIVRQRDGLTGGVGGFFQRRCVEVEVTTAPRLDVSVGGEGDDDAEPATPAKPAPPAVLPPDTKFVQRRADVRISASVPAAAHPEDADGWIEGVTRDIRGGGLLFAGRCELAVGATVDLRLTTGADEPPIEGRARVMRITDDGCRGLAFTELASAQRQRLVRFVFECERAALQQGRR